MLSALSVPVEVSMSIANRVSETIDKMDAGDPESALFSICAAIESTAVREYGKRGKSSYKKFIHENLGLITSIAFAGTRILNIHLGYDHPDIKKRADGLCSIEQILYHAVRCGLYHEASLPSNLKFSEPKQIRVEDGKVVLPSSLIFGFVMAVVVSPVNKDEISPKLSSLNFGSFSIPISMLWGRRGELLWLLEVVAEIKRLEAEAEVAAETLVAKEHAASTQP